MKIVVAKNSGFCGGVLNTVKKTKAYLKDNKKAYINGDIVHNEHVMNDLKNDGLITVSDFNNINACDTVIIRAHGERKEIYELLKDKNINIMDLTCKKVGKIHDLINEHKDYFTVVVGKKDHPEVIGHVSYAKDYFVVENMDDIDLLCDIVKKNNIKKIYIVSQTTFNDNLFDDLVNFIKEKIGIEIMINKTICDVTKMRQDEIRELSRKVDKMIIIGSKKSSNTKELVNVAGENNQNVYLISNINELDDIDFNNNDVIGIGAGASTPKEMIDSVKNYLQNKEK